MNRLLQHAISEQAQRRPDATALVMGQARMSFGDVETRSNQLAHLLRSGAVKDDRIAVLMPKCPEAILGILASLKADCPYVPMDSANPVPRLVKIIAASRPRWILTVPECAGLLDGILADVQLTSSLVMSLTKESFEGEHLECRFTARDWAAAPTSLPATESRDLDAAHVLFTSGSTGTPKGVVITHHNVTSYIDWAIAKFGVGQDDRHSCHPPLHFDLSTMDIYGTLGAGAELHLVPPEVSSMPQKLAALIRDNELTQWFSVPSIMKYMAKFDVIEHDDFPSLKRVLWCGEVLPNSTLAHWMERLPHARFTNLYGPTEATVASTYYDVPECPKDTSVPIPIGVPCTGEEALILDKNMSPVPDGEIGDLYLAGVGLSPGYWEDSQKTAEVFLPNPSAAAIHGDRIYRTGDLARRDSHGVMHFVGRADTQIKSRGYRIELGEIEAALHTLDALEESAIVAIPTEGFEGYTICCAYSLADNVDLKGAGLRKQLGELIPNYMLPSRWLNMDRLPQNVNGKIDRPALKDLFKAAVEAGQR